jgi:excisionase family DNA binding protein
MTISALPTWYTEEEIAERYGVSIFTVQRWRKAGALRAKRLGRVYKVREDWLLAWEEETEESPCVGDAMDNSASSGCRSDRAGHTGTSRGSTSGRDRLAERRRALTIAQRPSGSSPSDSH